MKIQILWYFVCWVFGFHSLHTLVEESHEVVYEKSNETEEIQYLVCLELEHLHPNRTIDLKRLGDDLCRLFNSSIDNGWRNNFPAEFEKLILNPTKSGRYLVYNGKACLIANDKDYELKEIFRFLAGKAVLIAIKKDTLDFVHMRLPFDTIDQLTVLKKEPPYSDCDKSNSRFFCLNECFKRKFRLARYFYYGNETGLIHLNYSGGDQTIKENERTCFEECKKENCKMVQLISNDGSYFDTIRKPKTETFEAHPKLCEFDFWVQLIGLICSFSGVSSYEFNSIAIEFTESKVRRRKVKIALFCLKLAILFLILAAFGYLCTRTILEQKTEETEKGITRNLIQPKVLNFAICIDMERYLRGYEKKTMLEIEWATNRALKDALDGIYMNYQGKSFRTDYQVQPKLLFKKLLRFYLRCFFLTIRPDNPVIPSNPKLTIKFDEETDHQLYLLSENEHLNGKSFEYSGRSAIMKRIVKRLKSSGRCVDYKEKYGYCSGRWNCMERCISRKFMARHNGTTFGTEDESIVIDRDWFDPTEWNTLYLKEIPDYNNSIYSSTSEECLQEIPDEKPCFEMRLEETVQIRRPDDRAKEIDLQFDVVQSFEESPSWYKLALDLVSVQGILFGFTVLGSLKMVGCLIQTRLKMRSNKIVLFFVYLLCSIGGIWQTYHISHLIISGELIPTRYYELEKEIQIPRMVFCRQINMKIDRNHKLTGNYLQDLNRALTAKKMFRSIDYLNESSEWTSFDFDRVKQFFLLNMNCFRIEIDQTYSRNQFYFSNESQVLKISFTSYATWKFIHFMTQNKETTEFSKIVDLIYGWRARYSITQEISLYQYEDRFSFIRSHFSSFQEDDIDLNERLLELQSNQHHLRTLNLPMEKIEFAMEVDEDLFEQLYAVRKYRKSRAHWNYQQFFVDNHLRRDEELQSDFSFNLVFLRKVVSSTNEENLAMLILSLLNVLSIWFDLGVLDLHSIFVLTRDYLLVYLYLHLPVFFFDKITQFLLFSCRWLKKLESPLYELLDPKKQNSEQA